MVPYLLSLCTLYSLRVATMERLSEETPLVPCRPQDGMETPVSSPKTPGAGRENAVSRVLTPPKARLRRLHSSPIKNFLSTGVDVDSLRLSYAAKLVLAAVEGRHVESAVDLLVLKGEGSFGNPLSYPLYSPILVFIILVHIGLALWEGGMHPFPLNPAVGAAEAFVSLCYAAHILLNLWTFGAKQYRDKKWHFTFTVLAISHLVLLIFAALAADSDRPPAQPAAAVGSSATGSTETAGAFAVEAIEGWWNAPRLALLGAQALRPMMLISNLTTIRRVFTNVLRTIRRTGSILTLGAVVIAFYSVLGINLFNSKQVSGYSESGDNFDSFGGAILSLFVLVTEENFPFVADPAFTQRPVVAFPFFVSFLMIFLVVILPLLLGIVLDAYALQHARQNERSRRKARNALLAAYFVLNDDGMEGLSKDQLVGVLTTEAGVGFDTEQVEQLWHVLVPEDRQGLAYNRSHSQPLASGNMLSSPPRPRRGVSTPAPVIAGGGGGGGGDGDGGRSNDGGIGDGGGGGGNVNGGGGGSSSSSAARAAFQLARSRAQSLPLGPHGSGRRDESRMDVRGFLRLADMLHVKFVDAGGARAGDGGDDPSAERGEGRACYIAGFDDDMMGTAGDDGEGGQDGWLGLGPAHGAGDGGGRGGGERQRGGASAGGGGGGGDGDDGDFSDGFTEGESEGEGEENVEQRGFLSDQEGQQGAHRSLPPSIGGDANGGGGNGVVNGGGCGGGGGGSAATAAPALASRQRAERCVRLACREARITTRYVVGRSWFGAASKGVAVLLAMQALAWRPLVQERYDGCLAGATCNMQNPGDFLRETLLRRVEGLVLLAFFVEMMAKVVAVGPGRLWRLHWAHRFDLFVLVAFLTAYLVVGLPGNTRALYVDRHPALSDLVDLPRAVAVLRLVTAFPQLRRLLETMSTVAAVLMKIMVLYSCVSYSFAVVGMAIFADAKSDVLPPRYSFSTLPEACLALFFMTVSNNWNDLLYPLINSVKAGRWSAVYFVTYMLFCATMMLDVLSGVVIEGFRVSTQGQDHARPAPPASPEPRSSEGGKGPRSRHGSGATNGPENDLENGSGGDGGGISGDSIGGDGGDSGGSGRSGGTPRKRRGGTGRGRGANAGRRPLVRKSSSRKYAQVKAEDMFRAPPPKGWTVNGEWDEEDMRELDEAVKTVEARLHQAWVSHVRKLGVIGEGDSV